MLRVGHSCRAGGRARAGRWQGCWRRARPPGRQASPRTLPPPQQLLLLLSPPAASPYGTAAAPALAAPSAHTPARSPCRCRPRESGGQWAHRNTATLATNEMKHGCPGLARPAASGHVDAPVVALRDVRHGMAEDWRRRCAVRRRQCSRREVSQHRRRCLWLPVWRCSSACLRLRISPGVGSRLAAGRRGLCAVPHAPSERSNCSEALR